MAKSLQIQIQPSLKNKLKQFEEMAESAVKQKLEDLAIYATSISTPSVDTGAYITSFSFNVGRGRPRGKSSLNRPRTGSKPDFAFKEQKREEGLALLQQDIAKIKDLKQVDKIELRNGAPHADYVESGNGKSRGHAIFAKIKSEFR